ncbi:uncharacterized protein LOC107045904 [Diachasma alloeum]|uniref:uncharacterized protein LOC107045904 n=1 Tax=Diachasma alloeum TaxID=454923 RepID=UPI0007384D9E|nr:uncharacterized protein LOC107045904 [Diachasma alloeum]
MKRVAYLQKRLNTFAIQVEKLEQYLESLNFDPINAKLRLDSLSTFYENCLKYKEELTSLQPDDPQVEAFVDIEARHFEVATAVTKLQRVEPLLSSTLNPSNITITERQDLPKLPKIRIPVFDGKRENWATYKNKFIALIHSRTDISDAVKCSQLFDSLTGQALAKVDQFDPSDKDYPKAWKTLLDFYDHKRIVAVEHLNAILDLPQFTKASADDLSTLLDKTRQHLHILEGLGARSGDDFVVRIVERCLPPAVRRKWQDKLGMDELPKLDDLLEFIQNTIFKQQAGDCVSLPIRTHNLKKRTGENLSQSSSKFATTTSHTFVTSSKDDSSASQLTSLVCPSCKEAHHLYKCPTFNGLRVQDRWNLVRKVKACHNCLWVHQFPCKSDKRSKKCSRNHHTLLHNEKGSQQSKPKDAATPTSGSSQQ